MKLKNDVERAAWLQLMAAAMAGSGWSEWEDGYDDGKHREIPERVAYLAASVADAALEEARARGALAVPRAKPKA